MNQKYISSYNETYAANLNIIQTDGDKYYSIDSISSNDMMTMMLNQGIQKQVIPYKNMDNHDISNIIKEYYNVVAGRLPKEKDEIVLEIKGDNTIDEDFSKALNISGDNLKVDDLLNVTFKLVLNDDYYIDYGDYFLPKLINKELYDNENNLTLKVVGVLKVKEEKTKYATPNNGIYYTVALQDYVLEKNGNSKIVQKQEESDFNIMTGEKFDLSTDDGKRSKNQILSYLGKKISPSVIYIYPKDFDSKEKILKHIDKFNKEQSDDNKIEYLDNAELITKMSGGIMDGITAVLVAFSSISLIVSSIMIGIITYISVLERTKEIGILRSLGARKKDIRRVFNAETFIIGLTSGLLGIGISGVLLIPINVLLKKLTDLNNVAVMDINASIILIIVSITLTLIGGAIPSRLASKKDPAVSLRTE